MSSHNVTDYSDTSVLDPNDFVDWATKHVTDGIHYGEPLRQLLWEIINNAVKNQVFGQKSR